MNIGINIWNLTEKIGKHHFDGVTQKIELVVEAIKKNIGTKIIFSDCTLFINKNNIIKLKNYLNNFANKDFDLVDQKVKKLQKQVEYHKLNKSR
jgi:hypothetical protein